MDGGIHLVPVPDLDGSLWLCGKHRIGPDPSGTLREVAAEHVVCLVHEHELADRYPSYVEWARSSGKVTWFPIHDLSAPPLSEFLPLLHALHRRLGDGESVIAHCAAGIGRAGTLAAAVCVMSGMTADDAVAHVRSHRPGAGPEVGPQRELLDALERSLGR